MPLPREQHLLDVITLEARPVSGRHETYGFWAHCSCEEAVLGPFAEKITLGQVIASINKHALEALRADAI